LGLYNANILVYAAFVCGTIIGAKKYNKKLAVYRIAQEKRDAVKTEAESIAEE
jgi:hypothetical protein